MNILEALKLVDEGKIVRVEIPDDDVYYMFNVEVLPFKNKEFTVISLWGQSRRGKSAPKSFSELRFQGMDDIEIACVRSNDFTEVTCDLILSEIQKGWKEYKEKFESD